jgi:hypothetical protein
MEKLRIMRCQRLMLDEHGHLLFSAICCFSKIQTTLRKLNHRSSLLLPSTPFRLRGEVLSIK